MNIFLTGGTGFIGSNFLRQALAAGHFVYATRRSLTNTASLTDERQLHWLHRQLAEVTVEDLQGCDVLVHLAAHSVQYPYDSISSCLHWNLLEVLNLCEKARLAGVRKFIVAGSCFEYGRSGERFDAIPTDAPLEPTNSYAVSKAAASIALHHWANENSIDLEILRLFHVFGEGEAESRFWPSLRRAALAGEDFPMTAGEQLRDFIHVESAAKIFLTRALIYDENHFSPRIFNVGSGKPCSLLSFATYWWENFNATGSIIPNSIPYRNNECMRLVPGDNCIYESDLTSYSPNSIPSL